MFSLTTAVKIDNKVQELVIMKKTNANLIDGKVFINSSIATDSRDDNDPLMTRNRVNIDSGTVSHGDSMSSGRSMSAGKISLWPIKRVATMPAA
mmetsp:Transcript_15014/g.38089  ORF Transcript_15014/g.38089 Transcript_15014/m.38089 type:complete len:94 (+) Transcript_15014:442-723(+)